MVVTEKIFIDACFDKYMKHATIELCEWMKKDPRDAHLILFRELFPSLDHYGLSHLVASNFTQQYLTAPPEHHSGVFAELCNFVWGITDAVMVQGPRGSMKNSSGEDMERLRNLSEELKNTHPDLVPVIMEFFQNPNIPQNIAGWPDKAQELYHLCHKISKQASEDSAKTLFPNTHLLPFLNVMYDSLFDILGTYAYKNSGLEQEIKSVSEESFKQSFFLISMNNPEIQKMGAALSKIESFLKKYNPDFDSMYPEGMLGPKMQSLMCKLYAEANLIIK